MPFLAMQGRPFFVHWSHTGQGVPRPSDADLTVEVWGHEELAALPNLPQRICTCQTQSRDKSVHCSHEPLQGRVFILFGGVLLSKQCHRDTPVPQDLRPNPSEIK